MYTLFAESDTGNTIRRREGELAQGGTRRHRGRARDRRGRSGRKRGRDPDQLRSRTRTSRASTGPRSSPTRSATATRSSPPSRPDGSTSAAARATSGGRRRRTRAARGRRACCPGTTVFQGGPWSRISDPVGRVRPAARRLDDLDPDVRNGVWTPFGSPSGILTSRSTDGGLTWQDPVTTVLRPGLLRQELDRLRHVAAEPALRELLHRVGRQRRRQPHPDEHVDRRRPHVGPARSRRRASIGLGGQPVVQPNGTVVVPYTTGNEIRVLPLDRRRRSIGRARSRSASSPSTRSPGICARRRSRRPRSMPKAASTSSGRTAASARTAARTTS